MPKPSKNKRTLRAKVQVREVDDSFIPVPVREAWIRGNVRDIPGKLTATQRSMLAEYEQIPADKRAFFYCCRRTGKTYLLAVLMLEHCIKNPGAHVHYVAATKSNIKEVLIPAMEELTVDCPAACLPQWYAHENQFRFPNGSIVRVSGVDGGNYKYLRGSKSTLTVIDEMAWIDNLNHVVRSVLAPMTLKSPGARTIMASSAPDEPSHQVLDLLAEARANGTCVERRITDWVWDTEEEHYRIEGERRRAIEDAGGTETAHYQREFLNSLVFDTSGAVVPEWCPELAKEVVRETSRPDHCFRWESFDPGFTSSHSAVLFGHVDYENACLVVEDEIDVVRTTTTDLAPLIKAKEKERWGELPVNYRYMDHDPNIQAMLQKEGIVFHGLGRKDLQAFTNRLRSWLKNGKVVIHPRCKKLIACLYKGTWQKQTTENGTLKYKFDAELGHFDLLAAITYACNRVRLDEDPRPYMGPYPGPRSMGPTGAPAAPSRQVQTLNDAFKRWSKAR